MNLEFLGHMYPMYCALVRSLPKSSHILVILVKLKFRNADKINLSSQLIEYLKQSKCFQGFKCPTNHHTDIKTLSLVSGDKMFVMYESPQNDTQTTQ